MSGHSKWATIKRKKGVTDAKRANQFTKLARAISVAAKTGKNLDLAVESAKGANMPKENIERAIKKGTGEMAGEEIIQTCYEAYGPEAVGIIINILTDNKNRALSEIKAVLNKFGGKLASSGAVSYLFEEKGEIVINKTNQTVADDDLEMIIIESGASDYEIEGDIIYIYTDPKNLNQVENNLKFKSLKADSAQIIMCPKNYVDVLENKKESIVKLLTHLEELDDVSEVYTNAEL